MWSCMGLTALEDMGLEGQLGHSLEGRVDEADPGHRGHSAW